ncbi:MAG TPA: hypothetical protein VHF91_11295 [Acidimicrobiales bacterium]|nr:hypothetical protein [Acidimicrobiales bacterium]
MTARRRLAAGIVTLLAGALAMAGCGNARGVADTRRALERSGYEKVDISLRSGGGVDVVTVEAEPAAAPPADTAAEVVWRTLPVRFDQLVVTLGRQPATFGHEALAGRFGPRDPALDRRQIGEEVVESGLKLMLLLSAGALLSVGAVVVTGLAALRAARRAWGGGRQRSDDQAEGPISGLGDDSPTADSAAEGSGDVIPS